MRKTQLRKSARSKNPARKRAKAKKSVARLEKRGASAAANALSAAFDPGKLEIQSRLEEAAFEQLAPGINLSTSDLSKSAPFLPGQMRFRLLRPEDLLVLEIQATDLKFENLRSADHAGDGTKPAMPHLVPAGSKGGLLAAVFRLPARRRKSPRRSERHPACATGRLGRS